MIFINKNRDIIDLNRFNEEAKLLNSKITCVLKLGDSDLRFSLSEELIASEEVALDEFVVAFVDVDISLQVPKIYDYVVGDSRHKHHTSIDYKTELTQTLIPKRVITKGEVTEVRWYSDLDAEYNPTNLILVADIAYVRDASGFAQNRVTTRTWINKDESENEERKITAKYYFINPVDMISEGLKRRKLLVSNIQMPMISFMCEVLMPSGYTQEAVMLIGRKFLDEYETDLNNFVENSSTITDPANENFGKKTIVVKLEDNTFDGINADYNLWLDKAPASLGGLTTIRQYLIGEFSI